MKTILANIFNRLFVRSAVAAWNFVRKHPWLTGALLFLFLFVIPFVSQAWRGYVWIRDALDWFKGVGRDADGNRVELPTLQRAMRWVVVVVIWVLIPGSSFLFLLGELSTLIFEWWQALRAEKNPALPLFIPPGGARG